MTDLDRKVARHLGYAPDFPEHDIPNFSTDPAEIGGLLLEAQKRGWNPRVRFVHYVKGKTWEVTFSGYQIESQSLPEAVCLAFCAASEKEKTNA